jgi:protein gp37
LVIAGCESGPNRRETKTEWARNLRDQCVDAGVPYMLKQLDIGGKLVKMPELDGKVWDGMPK